MRPLLVAALALAAVAGTVDLLGPNGERLGVIREKAGRLDVFDVNGQREGWGRRNADGSIELFDQKGNRVGSVDRDGKTLWLKQKGGERK